MEREKVGKLVLKMTTDERKNIDLIKREFGTLNYVDYEHQSLLHIFVDGLYNQQKTLYAIKSLLSSGLNPNSLDDFKYNFIQTALYSGYSETFILEIIKESISKDLNVNHQDKDQDTIVHTAIYSDDYHGKIINIYKLLCNYNFDSTLVDHNRRNIVEAMVRENKFANDEIKEVEIEYNKQVKILGGKVKPNRKITLSEDEIEEIESIGTLLNIKNYLNMPAVGRDFEMKKLIVTLAQEREIPIIVGESGVGKTALVDQLVYMIKNNQVPNFLIGQLILEINPSDIVSGCEYVGSFEKKMKDVINICKKYNIILFIDEIHTIYGVGSSKGKNNDMASILKKRIDRDHIKVIGTTTKGEYDEYFAEDALKRRFEMIQVPEPKDEVLYQIIDKVLVDYCNNSGFYFKNGDIKANIIRVLMDATREKCRVYNDKINNPALAISIIDKSFAFAKYYDDEYISEKHFIEGLECCDRIYVSVRNNAINRLRNLIGSKNENMCKILKIDFFKKKEN